MCDLAEPVVGLTCDTPAWSGWARCLPCETAECTPRRRDDMARTSAPPRRAEEADDTDAGADGEAAGEDGPGRGESEPAADGAWAAVGGVSAPEPGARREDGARAGAARSQADSARGDKEVAKARRGGGADGARRDAAAA
mmetsp:Transcript_21568/g.82085  ORF Transcript_21568/g.82085 Transcript_21568/m.82085 type:complete len:140 (+) Transcript_21568:196-615(+)